MSVRITTWNVNGIRNPFNYHPWSNNKTYLSMFDTLDADIICFQELKLQKKDLKDEMVLVPGFHSYFTFPKHRKGYSGVGIYTRNSKCNPIKAEEGITGHLDSPSGSPYIELPAEESIGGYPGITREDALVLDSEGRCLLLDFGGFVLIGTYCPAATDNARDDFRAAFVKAIFDRARNLIKAGREVVIIGDLNIARAEIDSCEAKEWKRSHGVDEWISTDTRRQLDELVAPGDGKLMVDLCREFWPDRTGMFTCWDVFKNKRPGNAGNRIDYILCSASIRAWFSEANIQEGLMGSDHCPVYTVLLPILPTTPPKHALDLLNPAGTFQHGARTTKPLPPPPNLCMRLSSEFRGRQSLKDMFQKMGTKALPTSSQKRPAPSEPLPSPATLTAKAEKKLKRSAPGKAAGQKNLSGFFIAKTPLATTPGLPNAHNTKEEDVVDPIVAKEKWGKLFTAKPKPVCQGHGEECVQLTVRKQGPNCGRAFWLCPRPIGPLGENEVKRGGGEWKCDYFKWASDV